MKQKLLLTLFLLMLFSMWLKAQKPQLLGVRFDAGRQVHAEVIYARYFGSHHRLDFGHSLGNYLPWEENRWIVGLNQFYNWQTAGRVKWTVGGGFVESVEVMNGSYRSFDFAVALQTGLMVDVTDNFSLGIDYRHSCKVLGYITSIWNMMGGLRLDWRF
ncbi:MAG: porin family protein [Paludibacteraceae bacterium]|nr:porin family protein [Paludibacteraceae bacterium]